MADVKEGISVEFGAKVAPFLGGINIATAAVGTFVGIASAKLLQFSRDSARVSASWEKAMGEIATIADATKGELASMQKGMADFSVKFGQDFETVAKARYNIISSGFGGISESMLVMTEAGKGAVGGLTTMDAAARALTAVLNAYELQGKDAARINDILFTTAKLGVPSYEELAAVIGDVASTAHAAKVPVEDLFAAMATISLGGISASESATALNRLLLSLIAPGKETKKVLAELGITLRGPGGLAGALKAIGKAGGENFEKLATAIPEMRALKGALTAAAEEGKRFAEVQRGIANSTGAADSAVKIMTATVDALDKRIKAQGEKNLNAFGKTDLPALTRSKELWLDILGIIERIADKRQEIADREQSDIDSSFFTQLRREYADWVDMVDERRAKGGSLADALSLTRMPKAPSPAIGQPVGWPYGGQVIGGPMLPAGPMSPMPTNAVTTVASWVTEMNAAIDKLRASNFGVKWNGINPNAVDSEMFAKKVMADVGQSGIGLKYEYGGLRPGEYGPPDMRPPIVVLADEQLAQLLSGRSDGRTAGGGLTEKTFGSVYATEQDRVTEGGLTARRGNVQTKQYEEAAKKVQMLGQIGSTVMTNMSSLIQGGIYGGLVRAFGGGQSAMAQFAAQTISQIATMIVQATILKGILSAIGLGGLPFESGGYTGMKEFAWGGYTGGGGAGGVAGVVHGGEYVLNRQATQAIGVQNLDRMNRGGGDTYRVGDIHIHGTSGEMSRTIAEEIRDALPRAIRDATRTGYMREALAIGRV